MRHAILALSCLLATCGIASGVRASPAFPGVVAEELGLDSAPSCTLCHTTPTGGFGTAETPFAQYLRSRGLRAGDPKSLENALLAAQGELHDSDDDGTSDVDELIAGDDPNTSGQSAPPPEFGCSVAHGHGSRTGTGPIALAWLALGAWMARLVTRRAISAAGYTGNSHARQKGPV